MRHFILGLCVLTASTQGAFAQTYLPVRDYSGPTTIVNMDILQAGGMADGHGAGSAYDVPSGFDVPPVSSTNLPPPMPIAPTVPAISGALVPDPVIVPMDMASSGPAPISRLNPDAGVNDLPPALPPAVLSAVHGDDMDSVSKMIAASPQAQPIIREKSVSAVSSANPVPYAPPMIASPVMPRSADIMPAGIASANVVANTAGNTQDAYRLGFDSGSSTLKNADKVVLDRLVSQMKSDPSLRLRMQAYAAGTPETSGQARRLSLARAMKVRSYMTEKGIAATRLDVRALGSGSAELNDNAARSNAPADRVDMLFLRG